MHKMPRQEKLAEVLRERHDGPMKDRRTPKGGSRNEQMELLEEYEEDLVECENCSSKIPFKDCVIFNGEYGQIYYCSDQCIEDAAE